MKTALATLFATLPLAALAPAQWTPGVVAWTPEDPTAPAIPRSLAIGSGGDLAIAACAGANARFELVGLAASGAQPSLAAFLLPQTGYSLEVAAGDDPDEYFGLSQVLVGGPLQRRTEVRCFDALSWSAGGQAVRWQHALPMLANGAGRLAAAHDGSRVYAAQFDDANMQVVVDALDGASGSLLWRRSWPAAGFNAMAASADGSTLAFVDGAAVVVADAQGAFLAAGWMTQASSLVALDADGDTLVHGDGAFLRVLRRQGAAWTTTQSLSGQSLEIPARAALSADGQTLALAWWTATNAGGVRLEAWNLASGQRLFHHQQPAVAGGLQNAVEAARISPDGSRAAFAVWGDGSTRPEVVAWDRAKSQVLVSLDLGGSAMGMDMARDGSRLVVARKSAHANQLSNSGDVRVVEFAARDLYLRSQPKVGTAVGWSARADGATSAILLDGALAPTPIQLGGLSGSLHVLRQGSRLVRRSCDAGGHAQGTLTLPPSIVAPGARRHLQVVFKTTSGWRAGSTVLHPLALP
ncbi:MAG: hypothetical protein RL112_1391 [Planctomycetota bacterium]